MIMKILLKLLPTRFVLAGFLVTMAASVSASEAEAQIEAARKALKADRQATVAQELKLTEAEGGAFWPVYHQYRAEMDKVGDGIKYLVIEYANLYPTVPEVRAKAMLKQLSDLEQKAASVRATYLKRVAKVLPPGKALLFAQVENRLDLAVRLELAAAIPLVPVEKK